MQRHTGLSSLQRHIDAAKSYDTLSNEVASQQAARLQSQLSLFQSALANFSSKHRQRIASSPEFRSHFNQLCAQLGVDPLGGAAKGLWDKMGVSDWYYALGVQVVDVCIQNRQRSGGLVKLETVIKGVERLRRGAKVTETDIRKAIDALEPLGSGYAILEAGGDKVVKCSPGGLDKDSLVVVEAASASGFVSANELFDFAKTWSMQRCVTALERALMDDDMAWIDEQASGPPLYWIPAMFEFSAT